MLFGCWDEGIGKEKEGMAYRQSERTAIYRGHLERLLAEKKAYWCYCTREELDAQKQLQAAEGAPQIYNGHCRHLTDAPADREPQVIRLRVSDNATIEFKDIIRGNVKTETALLGDFVIAKSLDEPLYNLAVVIDDEDMRVTHVIRGEDHISNTPKQILIREALGFPGPQYAHLPLILNADRSKLSKRNADVALLSYRERGFLPDAINNFLVLLGWHPQGDRELFTLGEVTDEFDLGRVQKGGAVWNDEKLIWLNREHMKKLSTEELEERLRPRLWPAAESVSGEFLHEVIEAVRDRMQTLNDFHELAQLFFELPEYAPELLVWKKGTPEEAKEVLPKLTAILESLDGYRDGLLEAALLPLVEQYGKGNVFWPLRVALSGLAASPDPMAIASVLGREESLRRVRLAADKIAKL